MQMLPVILVHNLVSSLPFSWQLWQLWFGRWHHLISERVRKHHHLEEILGMREAVVWIENTFPFLSFLPGLSIKELHALYSEDYGLKTHWNLRVFLKTITTTKRQQGLGPILLSHLHPHLEMDIIFPLGKTKQNMPQVISLYIFFV